MKRGNGKKTIILYGKIYGRSSSRAREAMPPMSPGKRKMFSENNNGYVVDA